MSLKRKIVGLLLLIVAGVVALGAWAESPDTLPKPDGKYVSDFAGVMDDASKQNMENLCSQLYTKAHATVVVVTIHSLDGLTIEDFTTRLQDKWRVGPKGSDRGVLMVFAIGDRKRRIEVGYGLEGILNDAKVGDIGRTMVPDLQQGQYGPAAQMGVQALGNVIAADANVTLDAPQPVQHTYHREPVQAHGLPWPLIIFVLFIVFSLFGRRGGGGGGGGFPWWLFFLNGFGGGGGGRGRYDGGDSGGGSSDSGGGGDFGGGFGGDSGGGGASGDW